MRIGVAYKNAHRLKLSVYFFLPVSEARGPVLTFQTALAILILKYGRCQVPSNLQKEIV